MSLTSWGNLGSGGKHWLFAQLGGPPPAPSLDRIGGSPNWAGHRPPLRWQDDGARLVVRPTGRATARPYAGKTMGQDWWFAQLGGPPPAPTLARRWGKWFAQLGGPPPLRFVAVDQRDDLQQGGHTPCLGDAAFRLVGRVALADFGDRADAVVAHLLDEGREQAA